MWSHHRRGPDCPIPIPLSGLPFCLNQLLFYILGFFSHVCLQLSSLKLKMPCWGLSQYGDEGRQGRDNEEGESGSHRCGGWGLPFCCRLRIGRWSQIDLNEFVHPAIYTSGFEGSGMPGDRHGFCLHRIEVPLIHLLASLPCLWSEAVSQDLFPHLYIQVNSCTYLEGYSLALNELTYINYHHNDWHIVNTSVVFIKGELPFPNLGVKNCCTFV